MNLTVNQDNLYLFLPAKVSWMATMLSEDEETSIVDAVCKIYSSNLYHQLENEDTKLWHLGPVDLYRDYTQQH